MPNNMTKMLRIGALVATVMTAAASGGHAQSGISFVSPQAAYDQGLGAYRAGYYQIALPALQFAAEHKIFLAQYLLAQIYADNQGAMTDHAKAYRQFLQIVEEHAAKIDVDDDERAPYVGKALTALARYVYRGLPEIGLESNAERSAEFLEEAATFFRENDAQFELAKLYLKGDGVPEDRRRALHWLSTLTQEGHVGAQAFLADLLWHGKILQKDEKRALALITVAVENAPPHERIWIEDIYQRIFCGAVPGVRQQADGLVASYRQLYVPRAGIDAGARISGEGFPSRSCGNGETLPLLQRERRALNAPTNNRGASPHSPIQNGVMDVRGQN